MELVDMPYPDNEKPAIDPPSEGAKIQGDISLRPDLIAIEIRRNKRDLETFRTLINIKTRLEKPESSTEWNSVIVNLLYVICDSTDVGDEEALLASIALNNVLFRSYQLDDFTRRLTSFWNLEECCVTAFGESFGIFDLEWFKLVLIHGYLQVNTGTIYTRDILSLNFKILQKNCLRYTKYSYFAQKTLQTWLKKTTKTNFWWENDVTAFEKDLEAIIFSSWDSCICEIARRNATQIFPTYLQIMSKKYAGFLNLILENCMENLSWQNELKYTILAEIFKISDDLSKILNSEFLCCLLTSLTKNHLKYSGIKLYLTILSKMKANEWEKIYNDRFFRTLAIWESEEQVTAVELFWEQWMKPTIIKFPKIFEFLYKHECLVELKLSKSFLDRIGDSQGFQLINEDNQDHEFREILNKRAIDILEPVRLNAFAVFCQLKNWKIAIDETEPFAAVKKFLYFNVNTSSIFMRKGIAKNFNILFANLVKLADKDPDVERHICDFLRWLHKFLLDCFECQASYQRKILALSLYEIILIFTSFDDCRMGILNADQSIRGERRKLIDCAINLRRKINGTERWFYCDSQSARIIYSLICDPDTEVRDKATFMILQYFCPQVFPPEEHEYHRKANYMFRANYEKIRNLWDPKFKAPLYDRKSTLHSYISSAEIQLRRIKSNFQSMLHRQENGLPLYDPLTVILEIGFLIEPVDRIYDESDIRRILNLAEDVTKFSLSVLSPEDKSVAERTSSFEKVVQAIQGLTMNSEMLEDSEECTLSSTQRLLLSCTWMSLKVSSEIAAEIGLIAEAEEFASRAVDLIVSILLKCRHKGAIEAAGLALGKLTKSLSKGKYRRFIASHLMDLLNVNNKENNIMTRRGAGLSIMLHRIVSNDAKKNRPWLRMTVQILLNSLEIKRPDIGSGLPPLRNEDFITDRSRAKNLHFLRSLVAEKGLQSQLVLYIEDICLTCFEYLQSSEWTVRNASLQLFGAIVPRLVGQCNVRELDYGIGNSLEYFRTHYPSLAYSVTSDLRSFVNKYRVREGKVCYNMHVSFNVVPILTLLSKMSSSGCELIDYSSNNYLSEAKKIFHTLFEYPVFNVRVLTGKAYAAFVPLPDIPYEVAELQLKSLSVEPMKMGNLEHGQFCAQLYLVRKMKHELRCTNDNFFIRKHKNCEDLVKRGSYLQLRLLGRIVNRWLKNKEQISYTVASALIRCLLESSVTFSSNDLPLNWMEAHVAISKMLEERTKPGFTEFLEDLMSLSARLKIAHDTTILMKIFHTDLHSIEHRASTVKNVNTKIFRSFTVGNFN